MKPRNLPLPSLLFAALSLVTFETAKAGTFTANFNDGATPAGTTLYGNAVIETTEGVTNSGCLKLTKAVANQTGSFVINDLDAGAPIASFTASFKALIGGGSGADGFSFNFATDLPAAAFGEEGAGSGLTVEFDSFLNSGGVDTAPSIDLIIGGVEIVTTNAPGLRANTFVDVVINLHPDGTLDVIYDGFYAYHNFDVSSLNGGVPLAAPQFGFGARTGGSTDNHFIDNLSITTQTTTNAFVDFLAPVGRNIRGDAPLKIILTDTNTAVDTTSFVLKLDGLTVTPGIAQSAPNTTISYTNPVLFASNSSHTVSLTFADNSSPTPVTNNLIYEFTVAPYSALPTNLAANLSYPDLANPGFFVRYSQIADSGSRDISRAELQLANLLIDGSTSLPYDNLAAPNPSDSSFTFAEANVINYAFPSGGAVGDFANDTDVPGIPGPTTGDGSKYAMDAVTYLHLTPGFYSLGVNSSDGFKLTVADGPDLFALQEAVFSSVRAPADTTASFSVSLDGYYPFRLVHFTGDPAYGPAPGTITPAVEFFNALTDGTKVLINDTNTSGYVPGFRASKTKPYVRSVSPAINDSGVPGNTAINATLVDGSLKVQTNTIVLQVNGNPVTPIISSNSGVYTVNYQPAAVFPPNSSNFIALAFTDTDSNRRTNTWSFTVANIMTPIWSIAAVNNTWVTAGSTERGLAYNPKTGHLLLVSRAAAPAPANALGIAILDSANGSVLGTMNVGVAASGPGTFKLNMIDVADDGVIYACNLSTSAAANFRIYRWQNESDTPSVVYDAAPTAAAGNPRWGDAFRVRGSGAGTQIVVSGNNASANSVPVFTTTDGTNFSLTLLTPTGLANNVVRLGLAWGCGNTFYGETTSTPMSYIGLNGPPSTAASLIASYGIYDKNNNQAMGPIGVDIANQRLIANQTISPHNINLYDIPSLVTTPTKNLPIDQRNYSSQNTSFGTGSVDFTPDGSRVFCLDTGNGIIAFSMAPRPAAPSICGQPQNDIIPLGRLGFFGVDAIGSTLTYRWRFNGINIANATNRTLDLPNIQQSQLGYYSVVVTNSLGSVTSAVAILDTPIIITNQPASQIVPIGGTASFNIGVSNGLPPYAYLWQYNGSPIPGATASTFTTNNVQVANAGPYTAVISDSLGQSVTSQVAVLTVGTAGTGTGLAAEYYGGQLQTFAPPATLIRIDSTVDFDWGTGSPDPSISPDLFSVRWAGLVQPFYSQTYTFYTTTDDGVRLWVNGQLLINKWVNQAPTEWSGTIALTANQQYPVLMEYFENTGGAVAHLGWSSPNQVKQVIPQTQLYPASSGLQPTFITSTSGGVTSLTIQWAGSYGLQSATDINGPWSPVAATSPYTVAIDPNTSQMFFRLVSQ